MVKLEEHPTVRSYNQKLRIDAKSSSPLNSMRTGYAPFAWKRAPTM
jgi:hypothetical protein